MRIAESNARRFDLCGKGKPGPCKAGETPAEKPAKKSRLGRAAKYTAVGAAALLAHRLGAARSAVLIGKRAAEAGVAFPENMAKLAVRTVKAGGIRRIRASAALHRTGDAHLLVAYDRVKKLLPLRSDPAYRQAAAHANVVHDSFLGLTRNRRSGQHAVKLKDSVQHLRNAEKSLRAIANSGHNSARKSTLRDARRAGAIARLMERHLR